MKSPEHGVKLLSHLVGTISSLDEIFNCLAVHSQVDDQAAFYAISLSYVLLMISAHTPLLFGA